MIIPSRSNNLFEFKKVAFYSYFKGIITSYSDLTIKNKEVNRIIIYGKAMFIAENLWNQYIIN